jgi:hypothetical protein
MRSGPMTDSRRNGSGSIDGGGVHWEAGWKLLRAYVLEVNYGCPDRNACAAD